MLIEFISTKKEPVSVSPQHIIGVKEKTILEGLGKEVTYTKVWLSGGYTLLLDESYQDVCNRVRDCLAIK